MPIGTAGVTQGMGSLLLTRSSDRPPRRPGQTDKTKVFQMPVSHSIGLAIKCPWPQQTPAASTHARKFIKKLKALVPTPRRLSGSAEPTSSSSGSRLSRPAAATAVPDRSPHPRISETRQSKHSGRPGRLSPFLAPLTLASLRAGSIASRAADQALLSAPHRFESGRGPQRGTPRPTGPSFFSHHGGNSHFSPLSSQQPSCSSEFADATVEAWQA